MKNNTELLKEIDRLKIGEGNYGDYNNKVMTLGMTDEQVNWIIAARYHYMRKGVEFAMSDSNDKVSLERSE